MTDVMDLLKIPQYRLLNCARLFPAIAAVACATAFASAAPLYAAPGNVLDEQKISDDAGGFGGDPDPGDFFGYDVTGIGDLNGDGVGDIAVGAPYEDDGDGNNFGAVWILFLDEDGRVDDEQKISAIAGDFDGRLSPGDEFGAGLAYLGDLDGDGNGDLAVGAPGDDDGGGQDAGAVWILFLDDDGTVKDEQKISDTEGGFDGSLPEEVAFGVSVAPIGDFNGDGVMDIAVGMPLNDDGGGLNAGGFYLLFLREDGTVTGEVEITDTEGGFEGNIDEETQFGYDITSLGDLNGDGITDLAVGAPFDDDGGDDNSGAVWILFMAEDGTVAAEQKISDFEGGMIDFNNLSPDDLFGYALASPGDVNGDGIQDLAVGAPLDDDGGGDDVGAFYFIFLNRDGTVAGLTKVSESEGEFRGELSQGDGFGTGLAIIDDINGDGVRDIVSGAPLDNDGGGVDSGAVWVIFLEGVETTCGDASGDGSLTAVDAQISLNVSVGLGSCELCVCDVDNTGSITVTDSLRALNAAVGVPTELSCPVCE